jgi:hypothetical protein
VGAVVVIVAVPEASEVAEPTTVPAMVNVTRVFAQKPLTLKVSAPPGVGVALLASTVGTPPWP